MADPPPLLHHYTSADGLYGILDTGTIWATDIRFLNDASEFAYACEPLVELFEWEAERPPFRSPAGAEDLVPPGLQPEAVIAWLQDDASSFRSYVACFCVESDLLSQWRAYGADRGYSLGFDLRSFPDGREQPLSDRGPFLRQVVYGAAAAREEIEEAADFARRAAASTDTVARHLAMALLLLLSGIKDLAFSEEQEWRILMKSWEQDDSLRFRKSPFGVAPYIDVPFPPGSLRHVTVGPGANADLRRRGVVELLKSKGLEDVEVEVSKVPLRT